MQTHSKWLSVIAGAGYSAKTVMYTMLGVFIISSAISALGSENTTQKHVFETIQSQPYGQVMLIAVVAGLICYALWRWLQCVLNTESLDMSKAKDVIMRVFLFVSGLIYLIAAYLGIKVFTGDDSSGQGGSDSQQMTAQLMQYEWGLIIVGAGAVAIIAFAFIQFKHAYTADFIKKFETERLSQGAQEATRKAGRVGYTARGVVYLLVGSFFAFAALNQDASEAGGLQKALETLTEQTFGQYLLGAVGVGFVMFGIYCAFEARYRRT
ncbi:DUF1206 domain-containing protein [Alteromonas halophila]|uniref:Membrane protein n=1 Tax=Alteromonas halophila TaxID=516698 RepID=A0A918JP37_9ALTE|nr:DUF1206 domain-containing protein [Alteromonas halophila]GGW91469.1 membrane protein [Alteromonas halophila]